MYCKPVNITCLCVKIKDRLVWKMGLLIKVSCKFSFLGFSEEERNGCFTLIVFLHFMCMSLFVYVPLPLSQIGMRWSVTCDGGISCF